MEYIRFEKNLTDPFINGLTRSDVLEILPRLDLDSKNQSFMALFKERVQDEHGIISSLRFSLDVFSLWTIEA